VGLREEGELARATALLERALALDPAFAEGWLELGNALLHGQRLPEAVAAYERAIHLDPSFGEAWANLAVAREEQGCFEEAIAAWRAVLALDPADGEALLDLARLLQAQERWAEACEAVQRAQAIALAAALLVRLADLLVRQNDWEGAVHHYRQALLSLRESPDTELHAQTLARLGVALHQRGQLDEAIHAYGQALRLRPDWVDTNAHRDAALERLKASLLHVRQTLSSLLAEEEARSEPTCGPAARAVRLVELGVVLHRSGCLEEALALYDQALGLAPDLEGVPALRAKAMEQWQDPSLLVDIARRFNLLGLFAEELRSLERASALAPDNTAIHLDRGLTLLRCGRFSEGWPLFAARRHPFSHRLPLPPWRQGHACERLLILPEKDIGDQIMFASMLGEAALLAPEPTVLVDPRLQALFARSFPQLRVLALEEPLNPSLFQAQLRMGCLGTSLRPSTLHFLAQRKAYLQANPATTQALRQRHRSGQESGHRPKGALLVGISWRSTSAANGVMKSVSLEALAGALALPGVRLLSLQYGDTRSELAELRRTTGLEVMADPHIDTFTDIDDLSALIAACDLVVTVSNTTAHLAGALGQRTWVLIDSRLDWRWGLNTPDTLWYPNARLFRQATAGDWATPLNAVQAELEALRRQDSPPIATPSSAGGQAWVF
jgi:tetratricopeptide (TPR) repeat protein